MKFFITLMFVVFGSNSVFASFNCAAHTVEQLKSQIIQISRDNMTKPENFAQIRTQLDPMIACLTSYSPEVTEQIIGQYSPGVWQQIWSDEFNFDPPGLPRDLAQIYQVIHPAGWGYNFGIRNSSQGPTLFILQVAASVSGNQSTTEITKAFSRDGGFFPQENLMKLSEEIYAGTAANVIERKAGQFPNGPIGAKGILTIVYLDENLKLGYAPNVYSGKIELFVMEKTGPLFQ